MTKTVFITGGATGIGQACVQKFHTMGWNTAFMDINTDWWMTLSPGDNVIRLTADEGRENLTASISAPKGVASSV